MKKVLIGILALIMVLGLVGCGSGGSNVTTEKFIQAYNSQMSETDQIDEFDIKETEDGFSFEKNNVSGTMDKNKNINYIKFVNENVECMYFSSEVDVWGLTKKFVEGDASNIYISDLNAYECIDEMKILYATCFNNNNPDLDEIAKILASKQPTAIDNWSISVSVDEENETVIVEAKYNK